MAYRLAGSLVVLRKQINDAWPDRSKATDGWIGDEAHRARKSDHNPNSAGVVQAIDVTDDDSVGADMRVVAERIRQSRDPRVKYVIHEGKMYSSYTTSSRRAWAWGPYSGLNGHFKHMHVSVRDDPALYDNGREWAILPDMPFTPEEENVLRQLVAEIQRVGSTAAFVGPTVRLIRVMRQIDDIFENEDF